MSNVCNTCQKPINWNKTKHEELGIKGALNPKMSIHRCYSEHKNGSTKEATKSDITLLQEISRLLNELIELKAPKKVYVGE
jgi:outer membrane receptor for ferric coprogen and ferric-rhodotorulic acid